MEDLVEIVRNGHEQMMLAMQDEKSIEVAPIIERLFGEMMQTGAESHTIITMLSSAIGYSLGRGSREAGLDSHAMSGFIAKAQSVMLYAAFDALANGSPVERETVQ